MASKPPKSDTAPADAPASDPAPIDGAEGTPPAPTPDPDPAPTAPADAPAVEVADGFVAMTHPDGGTCDAYERTDAGDLVVPFDDIPVMQDHGFTVVV